jgi:hypothetical protein
MFSTGAQIILRMDVEGVSLNGDVCILAHRVQIGPDSGIPYSPHVDVFWVGARVTDCSSGTLTCELSGHPGRVNSFYAQTVDPGIMKLILTGGEILKRLTGGNQPMPPRPRQKPSGSHQSIHLHKAPSAPTPAPEQSSRSEYPVQEYRMDYSFRFQDMKIVDGAALFSTDFDIPCFGRVPLELRVENGFLKIDFDYIKPYIAKRLGRITLTVSATIQTQGPEVIGTFATAELVDRITPDLIEQVRHWQIRRALNTAGSEGKLVTVDDLFREEVFEKSNIKPTDAEFVEDILAINKPKHADHIRYLSARHATTVMCLRWVKQQRAFLFLLLGKQDSFLILEKLNSKEATYLWKLHAKGSELSENRGLLKQKREWVEQEISIIRTEGRKVYKANTSDDFTAIWHDYESEDGFAVWKDRLHQVLDEND